MFPDNPPPPRQHAFMRLNGWELLYLVTFLAALVFIVFDNTLGTAERVISIVLISGCLAAYLRFGRRAVGVGYRSWEGRTYVVLLIVLFTPVTIICPPTRFLLFALCAQCFMMLPMNQAKVAVIIFNATPALEFLFVTPSMEELVTFLGVTVIAVTFALIFGPWLVGIIGQSRERASLIEELEARRAEVSRLSAERGALAERERLAGEIHDTLAQGFTSVVALSRAAQAALARGDAAAAGERLALIEHTASDNLDEARLIVAELTPGHLQSRTLGEALERLGAAVSSETGMRADVRVAGDPVPLGGSAEVVILRTAQEALSNVRRHASAAHVDLTLAYDDPDRVVLTVRDDGLGFDRDGLRSGFGLDGVEARAAEVGGAVEVLSEPGTGTTLRLVVPR
jgi:signal transduction histidine kinase